MSAFMSPGLDILKSWQGIVEMILRGSCVVSAIRAAKLGYSFSAR